MFTPTMTNAEIQREAYLDWLELKEHVQTAHSKYRRNYNSTMLNNQRCFLHSFGNKMKYCTKKHNTWNIEFHSHYFKQNMSMIGGINIYILLHRGEQTDYLFLSGGYKTFLPELYTSHFVQRFKERYLEPNNINLKGLNPVQYFIINSDDMRETMFFPKNWTDEDKLNKVIMLSQQGLSVTTVDDKLRTFITFLDQENLSQYKAMVYEEESLMIRFQQKDKFKDDPIAFAKHVHHIFKEPGAREIQERYLRRIIPPQIKEREEMIANFMKVGWDDYEKGIDKILAELEAEKKEYQLNKVKELYNKRMLNQPKDINLANFKSQDTD